MVVFIGIENELINKQYIKTAPIKNLEKLLCRVY